MLLGWHRAAPRSVLSFDGEPLESSRLEGVSRK